MSKSDDDSLRPATKLVQGGRRPEWTGDPRLGGGVVNPPVWRASTILYDNIADLKARGHATHDKLYYGRRGTPTVWALADALTGMEPGAEGRSEEHTSELQSLMGISYAVFCLKKKKETHRTKAE